LNPSFREKFNKRKIIKSLKKKKAIRWKALLLKRANDEI